MSNPADPHPFLSFPPDVESKDLSDYRDLPFFVSYLFRTETPHNIVPITSPDAPIDFKGGGNAFLKKPSSVKSLMRRMIFGALDRRVAGKGHTIFLFYWPKDGMAPYVSERVIRQGTEYLLGHDIHVLMELGDKVDYLDCHVRWYLPSYDEWHRRSLYHRFDMAPGSFIFLCGDKVTTTPHFRPILEAYDAYFCIFAREWLESQESVDPGLREQIGEMIG
ncbi:hypothetical protein FRC03_009845 [Tulasnella sp. 419]|nr:hypothetical protein FRC02_001339 [Tulasnella sp. 418]KAG8957737.1 hypothetical protein FRC03_009845 [Tulasnella sp. 419]